MRNRLVIFLTLGLCVLACSEDSAPPVQPLPVDTVMDMVKSNTRVVRDALEAYALDNDGYYPSSVTSQSGLLPYLVGGELLVNPVTDERTEPRYVTPAAEAGSVVYRPYWVYDEQFRRVRVGYELYGLGDEDQVFNLHNLPADAVDRFEIVTENCDLVRAAALAYSAENNGEFARYAAHDRNLAGKHLVDYLPSGELLINPFTGFPTEPSDGYATDYGSTGYTPIRTGGGSYIDGFVVDGVGAFLSERIEIWVVPE